MLRSGVFRSATALLAVALASSCGDGEPQTPSDPALTDGGPLVVATTSILGDLVVGVTGGSTRLAVLVPPGTDPHDFRLSSRRAVLLDEADLVVATGLGLEEGLADALEAAKADGANVLEVAPLVDPLPFADAPDGRRRDPHFWMDPLRVADAGRLIAAELAVIDPSRDWSELADAYSTQLAATDAQIQQLVAAVPVDDRKLITNHDSLGYFADRYGFEVIGTVIPGGTTLANPSSADLAALVGAIERESVKAIFADGVPATALAEAVAAEADVAVVQLHAGSLGPPGSGADSLIGMLLTNAERITAALS